MKEYKIGKIPPPSEKWEISMNLNRKIGMFNEWKIVFVGTKEECENKLKELQEDINEKR